jgi:hypothetical protein
MYTRSVQVCSDPCSDAGSLFHLQGPLNGGSVFLDNFAFTLDGKSDGTFKASSPSGCPAYMYDYLVYQRTGLPLAKHTFAISNIASGPPSDLLLDFAIVNTAGAQTSPSSTRTTSTAGPTSTPTSPTSPESPFPTIGNTDLVIDDTNPAWMYSGPWGAISAVNPCPACVSQPNPALVRPQLLNPAFITQSR